MGSYYQQKKNYNKYNPTQSFSDMDCYGNDYFGNNSENKEHSTNIYGNNAFKPIKSNTFNKKSSYSTSSYSKKNPPSSFLFFIYMFFSVIGIILVQSIGSNIIETHGRIFLRAFLWTIFESPIIYFLVWKMFLSKILNAYVDSENEIATCSFYSLIGIPICAIIINMGIIEYLNSSWDKSESVKWYLTVINKQVHTHRNSKTHSTSYSYHVYFTSWLSRNTFEKKVTSYEYSNFNVNDVVCVNTKSGYFGYPYYTTLYLVDKKQFPSGTRFPISEEEANPLIEQQKQLLEEEKQNSQYNNRNRYRKSYTSY